MLRTLPLIFQFSSALAAHAEPRVDRYSEPLPEGAVARLGSHRFRPALSRFSELIVAVSPDNKTPITGEWRGLRFGISPTVKKSAS
jgi:hypothetical protein